ncbi:DUF2218 domain-containing protein [Halocynthiibacter sp. C4]|uniref:DUF2218 domain-containing protein n=1 Tax=Halocynthiibacter sp. C4 TaxID=2992758 RepID=UPI00237B6ECF|nr:DUF2218 domain-containing protein [Halocynthiibacter sp. C4]MDE0591452.1 DUF2218 domain-containing protein [Halocynthiibacter sp. C4]
MLTQTGTFKTEQASKYLKQLCKHFAHKVDVKYDDTQGEAAMPFGPARLEAKENELSVEVTGDGPEQIEKARHVIDVHLQRFAFREEFEAMDWEDYS